MRGVAYSTLSFNFNAHGDVLGVYSGSTKVAEYEYDAFGNILESSETGFSNPIRYAGYYFDEYCYESDETVKNLGNYYLHNRYYNSKLSRFLTEDTYWNTTNMLSGNKTGEILYDIYYPALVQSGNRYAYAMGNPVVFVDPSGFVLTAWDKAHMTPDEQSLIEQYTEAWEDAFAVGNEEGMRAAHNLAESIRNTYRLTGEVGTGDGNTVPRVIVIDPGHGGRNDNGAVGSINIMGVAYVSYRESEFNLIVAERLESLLVGDGFKVNMTRTEDVAIRLDERYTIANEINADIFVSIHHNSINPFKTGYEVLYSGKHDVEESYDLANLIDNGFSKYTDLKQYSAPLKNTELAVLNGTKMPAVLIECGYMNNRDIQYNIFNRDKVVLAIFSGIQSYFVNK